MSKIFEALQVAQNESTETVRKDTKPVRVSRTEHIPSTVGHDFESELVNLYQNIEASLPDLMQKTILFIGAKEGEGTSTVVREFAGLAAKKLGKSVFILDAEGKTSHARHSFLHITPDSEWEEVTRDGTAMEMIVSPGKMDLEACPAIRATSLAPLNFYSPAICDYWESLKERYDYILIDGAPASLSPDGIEIARKVDGVVLVVEAEKTRWPVVEKLKERILHGGGNILGIVLNKRRFHIPEAIYKRL
jgi:Mrp family chromosome partitioning ATPase